MKIDKEARDKIIERLNECDELGGYTVETAKVLSHLEDFINSIPVDDSPVNKSGNITLTEKENELLSMLYRALGIMNTPHSKQYNKFFKGLVEDLRKFLKIKI